MPRKGLLNRRLKNRGLQKSGCPRAWPGSCFPSQAKNQLPERKVRFWQPKLWISTSFLLVRQFTFFFVDFPLNYFYAKWQAALPTGETHAEPRTIPPT